MHSEIWKSARLLADGREIIYFDEAPDSGRADLADERELPRVEPAGSEQGSVPDDRLRWDPLLGEWVAFAEVRQGRTFLPSAGDCPLCPSRPGKLTEVPAPDYDVVVFENKFPAFAGSFSGPVVGAGLYDRRPASGRCEVVCFTADHDASFADLSARRTSTVLAAWADRTTEVGQIAGIEHVYCFENRGPEVGVTLQHPHGQVYALPFVPPRIKQMLARAQDYRANHGGNLFDDLLAAEVSDGLRVVVRNDHWTAFVPAAARWPFEVLVMPSHRVPDLGYLSHDAVAAFGDIYPAVLRRLDALFDAPMPYMAVWHQAPVGSPDARRELAAFVQIMAMRRAPGKLKYRASTESGADVWSSDVLPETAARMLREAG